MVYCRALFLLASVLCASPSLAQVTDTKPEVRELALQTLDPALESPEGRLSLILALSNYCNALKREFPTNSPVEEEWLNREINGGGDRIYRALASAEWGRRQARQFTENCLYYAEQYLQKPDYKAIWLFGLIETISRFQPDAEIYSRRNGLAPEDWGFTTLGSSIRTLSRAGVYELSSQTQGQ